MKGIISIQAHVVYGHSGNSSAVFPVQRMGLEMWPIHTVQYSDNTHCRQVNLGYNKGDIDKVLVVRELGRTCSNGFKLDKLRFSKDIGKY